MNLSWDFWTLVGVFLTLSIFSFLYRDNPFYRFSEHLAIGVANGYTIAFMYHRVIVPVMLNPFIESFRIAGREGLNAELFNPTAPANFWVIVPALIGLMYFMRFVPKAAWLVRFPIGIFMGYYTGMSVPAVFEGSVFPQLRGTMLNRGSFDDPMSGIWGLVVLIGVLGTLTYFFFSKEQKGILKVGAKTGIIFVMIGFGASFGFTVMARVSVAIGRFYFLLRDWLGVIT